MNLVSVLCLCTSSLLKFSQQGGGKVVTFLCKGLDVHQFYVNTSKVMQILHVRVWITTPVFFFGRGRGIKVVQNLHSGATGTTPLKIDLVTCKHFFFFFKVSIDIIWHKIIVKLLFQYYRMPKQYHRYRFI